MEQEVTVVRNYKDTIFRMIFKDPEELLGLFNAINDTAYTDVNDLEVTTLENAVYMNVKNDLSCMLDMRLALFEHQSTVNPNIVLRLLIYVTKQFERMVSGKDIYSSKAIRLPNPKFVVFYNGVDAQPEMREYRLSELYHRHEEDREVELELKVVQLNINKGYNEELKRKCRTLFEYMEYVERVRYYRRTMILDEAVNRAVEECISEGILKKFLTEHRAEAISMSIFEYDEELHLRNLKEEGREEGREEEHKKWAADIISSVDNLRANLHLSIDAACNAIGKTVEEYNNAKKLIS